MSRSPLPFGSYVDGDSWLHRAPFLAKLAAVAALAGAAYLLSWLLPSAWLPLLALLLALGLLFPLCRLPIRLALRPLWVLLPMAALLLLYHALSSGIPRGLQTGLAVTLTLFCCVYAASLVSLTSTITEILDGLGALVRPLRRLGASPETFALTVAILIRSVPALLAAFGRVHQAAKARGLQRSVRAHVVPTMIAALALAQHTGEALVARGLGDDRG